MEVSPTGTLIEWQGRPSAEPRDRLVGEFTHPFRRMARKGGWFRCGTPSLRRDNPGSVLSGRVVPDVLGVATFEVGDPVVVLVLVKANDAALDRRPVSQLKGASRVRRGWIAP